ncbi:MAG: nucleotidyltransferase family protein [Magnetococcales bacterium]|nr:nucleotidyltransferase family protein [Magnetococcales bacterium]
MKAMILAAGRGERLQPLTDHTPKPLVPVAGKAVIAHTLERLAVLGFRQVVINAHHLADKLMDQVGDGSTWGVEIIWSREEGLMNTGGGVRQALPLLGEEPFLAVNGDIMWDLDLRGLLDRFDPEKMDALLGLVANPFHHGGDFTLMDDQGTLKRTPGGAGSRTYSGVQIVHPKAVAAFPLEPFSLNRLYDQALGAGRLFGLALEGCWADMGAPDRLLEARRMWGEPDPSLG